MNGFLFWLAKTEFAGRRAEFYADLAEALEDNGSLVEIITSLAERAKGRKDVMEAVYNLWLRRMDDRSFAASLAGTVPDSDLMILEASESTNNLSQGLRFLSTSIESVNDMKAELKKAIGGPIFLVLMFAAMLVGYAKFLVPILVQVIPPNQWPMIGKFLYAIAEFINNYGGYLLAAIVVSGITYIRSLSRWYGHGRVVADRYLPIYSIYRDFNGSIFLVSLASLMRAKIGLAESLQIIQRRASPWLHWHISLILHRLEISADQPIKAFETGVFSQRLTDRVVDYGARSKSFEQAIAKVGLNSIDKTKKSVADTAGLINRILIFFCGACLISMIAGVMLTAQEAQSAIQRQSNMSR